MTDEALELVERDGIVELRDRKLDSALLATFRPVTGPSKDPDKLLPAAQAMARSLAEAIPAAQSIMQSSGRLVVEFTPAVQRSLHSGALSLMQSSRGTLATAVDGSGRIVQHGRVVQVGTGAAFAAAAPALFLGVAANVMAAAQMARIEQAIAQVQRTVARIEQRTWDDDVGKVHAAATLSAVIRPSLARGRVGEQLRIELAVTAREVEALYYARRRTSERLILALEERAGTWGDAVSRLLAGEETASTEAELFMAAAIARAGLLSARAGLLALDGDHEAALELTGIVDGDVARDCRRLIAALEPFVLTTSGGSRLRNHILQEAKRKKGRAERFERVVTASDSLRPLVGGSDEPTRLEIGS